MELYYPPMYRGYGPITMGILRVFYRLRAQRWARMKDTPGSVLEIGCGTGLMLDALRHAGWQVMGTERTERVAAYARDKMGLNVVSGGLEMVDKNARFNLIILFNVLEHLSDPLSILKECAARLKPDGFVVLSVPNFASPQARLQGRMWPHLDPPRHIVHFTPKSLANTLHYAGLDVHGTSFVSFEHDPYGWIEGTINKVTGSYNVLTRYLMGINHFSTQVALLGFLGILLVVPAVLLSMATWVMGNGALMEVIAKRNLAYQELK